MQEQSESAPAPPNAETLDPIKAANSPLHSFDARDWAKEFCDIYERLHGTRPDEGWMLSWFANALMRGYDEHRWKIEPRLRELAMLARVANNTKPTMQRGLTIIANVVNYLEHGRFTEAEELLGGDVAQATEPERASDRSDLDTIRPSAPAAVSERPQPEAPDPKYITTYTERLFPHGSSSANQEACDQECCDRFVNGSARCRHQRTATEFAATSLRSVAEGRSRSDALKAVIESEISEVLHAAGTKSFDRVYKEAVAEILKAAHGAVVPQQEK